VVHFAVQFTVYIVYWYYGSAQAGPGRWDPLRNTVHLTVDENHQAHKWRGYDDPHDGKTPMAGFLLKRGHVRTNWVQRYFKLEKLDHHPVLRYFLHDDSSRHQTAKGAISLVNAYLSPGIPCCSDGRRNYFMLHSGSQELHLNALTEGDMRRWIHALANAIQLRPTSPPRPMHVVSAQAVHVAKQLPRVHLPDVPGRPHCVAVGRSPADKLVLQAASEDEQISWAATLHCSIVMASQGLSVAGLDTNEPFSH
ncbi:hypothetical protein AaE_010286, partial [Aphanomyces astaci]